MNISKLKIGDAVQCRYSEDDWFDGTIVCLQLSQGRVLFFSAKGADARKGHDGTGDGPEWGHWWLFGANGRQWRAAKQSQNGGKNPVGTR